MAHHEITVETTVAPAEVLAALLDPATLVTLDGGLRSVAAVTDGPPATGARTRAVHAFFGRDVVLDHELVHLDERGFERLGTAKRLAMTETVTVGAGPDGGSLVGIAVTVRLGGLLRPLDGGLTAVLESRLDRLGDALAALSTTRS